MTIIKGNADLLGEGQWTGTPDTADGHASPITYVDPQVEQAMADMRALTNRLVVEVGAVMAVAGYVLGLAT